MSALTIACPCGRCRIALTGQPILAAECHCTSCRQAAEGLESLPGAPQERSPTGGVPYVLWRKDRVGPITGAGHLADRRLGPQSTTRRIIATCCNAPMFLEFKGGHWLSIHAARWPATQRPAPALRTMTRDRPPGAPPLPDDIPNARTHSARFMLRLLGAWIAMGFRNPAVAPDVPAHG